MGPTEGAGRGGVCGLWIGGAFTLSMSCSSHGTSLNSPPPSAKKKKPDFLTHAQRREKEERQKEDGTCECSKMLNALKLSFSGEGLT